MTTHQDLLDNLIQWSQGDMVKVVDSDQNGESQNDALTINRIISAKRGKAQRLPSDVLMPV